LLSAGLRGGAAAGLADAAITALVQPGAGARGVWLGLLGVGLGGLAGGLLSLLYFGLRSTLARLPSLFGTRAAAGAAAVVAAPLVVYDAFALFAGTRASRVPAHHFISAALAAGGLLAIAWIASRLAAAVAGGAQGGAGQAGLRVTVVVLLALAAGSYWANRALLPRLYPWFHLTLGFALLVLAVVAARVAFARAGAAPPRRRALVALALALLAGAGAGVVLVRGSQTLLFIAHERTQLTGMLLKAVPLRLPRRPVSLAKLPPQDDQAGAPLPEGPHLPEADVVLITIDALRADHVGAYGYARATTPNIDALARRGARFERAYAQAPHTSYSVASMLTGKYYPTLARLAPGDPHDPIALLLRQYGWKTSAFYPPAVFFVDGDKLKAYQENNFQFEYVKVGDFTDANGRLSQIAEFFAKERPRKTFLWVHLFEPHEPYEKREGFDFGNKDMDRYDSEIAYADAAVGRLLAYLQKNRPGAIVIVTADHGEEFDEHGGRYHGGTLYEEQIRVPLVIAVPGVEPRVLSGPVELIDLAPTILGLLDIPVPVRMRGTDLGPWLASPPAPASRFLPAFAELEEQRMVVLGTEKLVCKMNFGYCEYFDLAADPHEKRNLAEAHPDRVAVLQRRLDHWLDDHVRFEPQLIKGMANPDGGAIPKSIERGRLGDLSAVVELAAMLRSNESLGVRREAARLLVTALPRRKETHDLVMGALGSEDAEIRDWAAVAAARLGESSVQARLREVVSPQAAKAVSSELRIHAGLALAKLRDASAVAPLADSLETCGSVALCRLVILALGDLRDGRGAPALLAHLPQVQNRREMVDALGQIADPQSTDALLERLTADEYVPVRAAAATALGKIGGDKVRAGLKRCLAREHEPSVLDAAKAALAALEPVSAPPSPPRSSAGTARSPRQGRGL
jgi:arylsulfatase A-like enzyme/HEAT repeat protein